MESLMPVAQPWPIWLRLLSAFAGAGIAGAFALLVWIKQQMPWIFLWVPCFAVLGYLWRELSIYLGWRRDGDTPPANTISYFLILVGWISLTLGRALFAEAMLERIIWSAIFFIPFGILGYIAWRGPTVWAKDSHSISFNDESFTLSFRHPRKKAYDRTFYWSAVRTSKFITKGLMHSDELWIFGADGRKPFLKIPTEATGGAEFLSALMARQSLDPEEVISKAGDT